MDNNILPTNAFDGRQVKVLTAEVLGPKLKGMSSGKIFKTKQGTYCFNLNDQLYEAKSLEATDQSGIKIDLERIPFDTENRISGIVQRGNKTLLIHRIKNGKEYYTFPGGHNHVTETFEQTLVREMEEEAGLKIKPVALFMEFNQEGFATEYFCTTVEVEEKEPRLINPDVKEGETAEIVWVDNDTCSQMDNILPNIIATKLFSTKQR